MSAALPKIEKFGKNLPPGFKMEIGGEYEEQVKGFKNLAMVGALAALWIMGAPFGFMAFLGIASLVGILVSHVIVLFDFIEEAHKRGEPLIESLLDAGIVRLRPVLITVGATVLLCFRWPLTAAHSGNLSVTRKSGG